MPVSHQYLLTVLSIWWAVGQLIASLVGISDLLLVSLWTSLMHYHLSPVYRLLGHYSQTFLVNLLRTPSVCHLKTKDGVIFSIRWVGS